jgi:hypothetical protein
MYVPHAEQIVDLCIEHQVRAVSYSRSPSAATVERLKAAGIVCIPTVGAKRHAVKAVEMGADAVVIQGGEGGGHTGSVATSILLPQVRDAIDVPYRGCRRFPGRARSCCRIGNGGGWYCHGHAILTDAGVPGSRGHKVYLSRHAAREDCRQHAVGWLCLSA